VSDNLLSAVIGAIVGALAAATVNWMQGRARMRQERLGVRMLLRLEAAHNLATLNEFWNKVTSKQFFLPGVGYEHDVEMLHYRYRLAKQPLQPWGLLMWESQAALMAGALDETEIEHVYNLYESLARFTLLRSRLQDEFNGKLGRMVTENYFEIWMSIKRDHTEQQNANFAQLEQDMPIFARLFNRDTIDLWVELEGIYNRIHQLGNPVHQDAPVRRITGWLRASWRPRRTHKPDMGAMPSSSD
jgi:hypothetical protein